MRQSKGWLVVLVWGAMLLALVGCKQQPKEPDILTSEHNTEAEQNQKNEGAQSSIYNTAFEAYNDITELAVIINNPTSEDLSKLTTVDTYGDDKQQSMLIIPKYNGSKITVSTAEYTGEQYIAKTDLFTKEATTEGYGLRLYANRPEGIPELIVTINYQKVNRRYVISSNGKDGNIGIEYLRVETENTLEQQGDLISPIQDTTYTEGLNLFSRTTIDIDSDGENEAVEVYCDGEIDENGDYLMDDGQNWALILRKDDAIYPLFNKEYIQIGGLQYAIYQDYDDYDKVHIIIEYKSGTALYYYDCTYDNKSGDILRNDFFEARNINLIKSWQ